MDFGTKSLAHPLLVEAAETLFHPVLVYNNRPEDEPLLARFEEPSWNNPVLRFLDGRGEDVLPRRDRVWTPAEVAARLVEVLRAAGRPVPSWLALAAEELTPRRERLALAMHCFWEGEAALGGLEGVVGTRCGFHGSAEVVQVEFDPARRSAESLLRAARELDCADGVHVARPGLARRLGVEPDATEIRDAPEGDQLHALRAHPDLDRLPLTRLQAVRLNSALARGDRAAGLALLSPRQRELHQRVLEALARDPEALADLRRPDGIEELDEFQDRLAAALDRLADPASGSRRGESQREASAADSSGGLQPSAESRAETSIRQS